MEGLLSVRRNIPASIGKRHYTAGAPSRRCKFGRSGAAAPHYCLYKRRGGGENYHDPHTMQKEESA
jgi:hypothetical protein